MDDIRATRFSPRIPLLLRNKSSPRWAIARTASRSAYAGPAFRSWLNVPTLRFLRRNTPWLETDLDPPDLIRLSEDPPSRDRIERHRPFPDDALEVFDMATLGFPQDMETFHTPAITMPSWARCPRGIHF